MKLFSIMVGDQAVLRKGVGYIGGYYMKNRNSIYYLSLIALAALISQNLQQFQRPPW